MAKKAALTQFQPGLHPSRRLPSPCGLRRAPQDEVLDPHGEERRRRVSNHEAAGPRSRGMICPGCANNSMPSKKIEGAGNAGHPMRPIAACAMIVVERTRVSQVTPESPGIPHAMVYGLLRALPGAPGFLATVACATSRRLDTSVGVSGPHAFSVRLKRPRQKRHQRPPHPAANVRDDRETPLKWRRDGGHIRLIWVGPQALFPKIGNRSPGQ